MRIIRYIPGIILFFTPIAGAQEFNTYPGNLQHIQFDHLTIEDGLANSTINHIIQDEQGFIWFAALNALCRYDGYGFKTYKHNPKNPNSLSGDRITALVECEDGKLFVGTWQKGLDVLDPARESIQHYRFDRTNEGSIGSNQVGAIFRDTLNRIWVATGNTLNLFNKTRGTFKRYCLPEKSLTINSIIDYQGTLWLGTDQLKIFIFHWENESFTEMPVIPYKNLDPLIWRCKLYVDSKDILWICTVKNGLYRYDPSMKKIQQFQHDPDNPYSISHNDVFDIIEDENHNYWVTTDGGGLNYFDYAEKKFYHLKNDPEKPTSLSNNQPHCIFRDNTNIIWIGLYNGGVNSYNKHKEKFISFRHNPNDKYSISHNIVWSFLQDKDGDILIGTDRGGLNLYNPAKYGEHFIRYLHDPNDPGSIPSNTIISIYQDSRDIIWLGTYNNGLVRFDKKNNSFTSILANESDPESIHHPSGNDVWDIQEDSQGRLWIATLRYGVDVYEPVDKEFTHFREDNSNLSNNQVTTICIDSKNRIWIGTADGLNLYNAEKNDFTVYMHDDADENTLPGNNIRTIYEDNEHNLWIGTEGNGLCHMNAQTCTCTNFSEEDGLPSDVVYGMLEDNQHHLWISTSRGLTKFNPDTKEFRHYTRMEGLQSNEFKQNSCLKTGDGNMYFGGIEGFNVFHPDSIKDNPFIPPVVITGFSIFNIPVEIGKEGSPLTENIQSTKEVILSYKQSVFSFQYTALNYTITEKNQYSYIMEGFDKVWNDVGNKREATYTNLDPGTYTFKVKASNNDNIWNEEGTWIHITILPPWWKTWFFRISSILLLLGFAISFYFIRINQIKRQNQILEKKVVLRTEALRNANFELKQKQDEVTTQNEEIQQQNEEILAQRDEIQKKNEALENTYNKLKTLNRFGQELTTLLDLDAINNMIYDYVTSLVDTSVLGIGIYDEVRGRINFNSFMEGGIPIPPFSSDLDDTTSCAAWCFKNQKPIIANNFKKEYKNFISDLKIRSSKVPESLINLPLTVINKQIGILTVQSYNKNAYIENDLQTLQSLASYIAIALDNANAYHIVKEQNKELDIHRLELEELVRKRTNDLEAAKMKAEESDKLKSAFLANMSHEIRTPLNAIVGFAEVLSTEDYSIVSKNEIIKIIEHNASSLLNLINDIIDFSKIEAGEITITLTRVNPDPLLKEIFQIYTEELKKNKKEPLVQLHLNLNSTDNIPILITDPIRLRQILNNLIDNAIKYTSQGHIEFGYKITQNDYITFYVKDTGIGIERQYFNIIFDRFRKIEGEDKHYRGTGLGLSITKYLVERMGGTIWLESEPGKGSEFMFNLPFNKYLVDAVYKTAQKSNKTAFPDWTGKTLLVVEDEESNYLLINSLLKKTNITIIWAKNGQESIRLFKKGKNTIDLVLMDIKLPKKDGITAAKEMKSMDPNIPIVAQTAYALPEEEHTIRTAGFNDYISKPIKKDILMGILTELLS